jgi:hypothetical protein
MARQRRQRVVGKANIRWNDIPLEGQGFIVLGACNQRGETKDVKGKALPKKSMDHLKLRIEDKAWMTQNALKHFYESVVSQSTFEKFFDKETPTL